MKKISTLEIRLNNMKILVINIAMIQFVILEQIKVKKQLKYITSMYRIIEIKVNIT